ncbi:hypothetical protein [Nitrospirillum sp. BR 11828]|uniref:hypothetical protein n=1 Tax=Nitrospirillum sp. BR 11828 TaxID=3104325 RepID=UPI002ACA5423|nr:hypothetical protein [Nitrospirillum sp. BR 11828]MDZ5648027.1 hypothetical protein [Nitrospirillum sp. BR 11828]
MWTWLARVLLYLPLIGMSCTAMAQVPPPTAGQFKAFKQAGKLHNYFDFVTIEDWGDRLHATSTLRGLREWSQPLARAYALTPEQATDLLHLVVLTGAYEHFEREAPHQAQKLRLILRNAFIALARTSNHTTVVLEAAGQAMGAARFCDAATYQALLPEVEPGRTTGAWLLAHQADCPQWYAGFAHEAPGYSGAALWGLSRSADTPDELALLDYLATDRALVDVFKADRAAFKLAYARQYAAALANAGLAEQLVLFVDGLPPDIRKQLTADDGPNAETAMVDGLQLALPQPNLTDLTLNLAAAEILQKRDADADALLAPYTVDLEKAKADMICAYNADRPLDQPHLWWARRCPIIPMGQRKLIVLDHLLHHAAEDPYPLAETLYADHTSLADGGGVWPAISCRLLAEGSLHSMCDRALRPRPLETDPDTRQAAAVTTDALRLVLPDYDARRQKMDTALAASSTGRDAKQTAWKVADKPPLPPPWVSLPLPSIWRGPGAASKSGGTRGMAPLPANFQQVRVWHQGRRVAVISVAAIYDQASVKSRGGYWLHLSDDGGQSWRPPLYTGLVERFPYVVRRDAKLPLLDGDDLTLAVDAEERVQTETGPFGEQTFRRWARDLFLRIPLAELARDSDGDGMSDIAERHLLLPSAGTTPADGPLPMKIRPDQPRPCPVASRYDAMALATVLAARRSNPNDRLMASLDDQQERQDQPGAPYLDSAPPTIIVARQADFACLRAEQRLIVYDRNDPRVQRLRAGPGNFDPTTVTPIVFNAARDRGFIEMGDRWSGIVIRLRRIENGWRLDVIDHRTV